MVNLDIAELRSKIELESKYVDFAILRAALSVVKVVRDLDVSLTDPSKQGECRGTCPKCKKEKSFSLNINSNRFNCFAKGCTLKGGGVIDFFAKLFEVSAKEASHLLAYVYGIQPYAQEAPVEARNNQAHDKSSPENTPVEREVSKPSSGFSQPVPPLTPQHLIASIEHQFAQLKQLLIS